MKSSRIAIVGGGISGLSVARELVASGAQVVVYESADRTGGLLGTDHREGFILERAANAFLPAPESTHDLARALGVDMEPAAPTAKRRWVYRGGELVSLGPRVLLGSQLLTWRDKLRLVAEPLVPRGGGESESVYDFFARRFGVGVADAMADLLCAGIFSGSARDLELSAAFPRLAALEAGGGVIVNAIRRARAGRGGPVRRLAAPRGGAGALATALGASLGDSVRAGEEVLSVCRVDAGVLVDTHGDSEVFDAAVLAVPARSAARVLTGDSELARLLSVQQCASVAVVHLGYERARIGHDLDGFGFLVSAGEDAPMVGCVFESMLWPDRAPPGHVLLRCIVGGTRQPELAFAPDIAERCADMLARTLEIRGEPVFTNVLRHRDAIPQYGLGHGQWVQDCESAAEAHRVVLAGNAYRGVAVNDCVSGARRASRRVLAIAAVTAMGLVGCSTKPTPLAAGDSTPLLGESGETLSAGGGSATAAANDADTSGEVSVFVSWKWPPPTLQRSPGRDGCGHAIRPPVSIHPAGGVRDAVVELVTEGKSSSQGPSKSVEVHLADCQFSPRVTVVGPGDEVWLASLMAGRRDVEITGMAPVRLSTVGQRRLIRVAGGGVQTMRSPGVSGGHLWATAARAVITEATGRAVFDHVSGGVHQLRVWHPSFGDARSVIIKDFEMPEHGGTQVRVQVPL